MTKSKSIDLTELVLVTYGFRDLEAWQADPFFGDKSEEEIMVIAGYKSPTEWESAVMPLHREIQALIMAALNRLWSVIGRKADPQQLTIYFEFFQDYPPEVLRKAVDHVIGNHKYTSIPTIAEIKDAIAIVIPLMSGEVGW